MSNSKYFIYTKYLIPTEVVDQVHDAAPRPLGRDKLATDLALRTLVSLSTYEYQWVGVGGRRYYEASLATVARAYERIGEIEDGAVDNKAVGRQLRMLGLTMIRRNDGYRVLWTAEQVQIIADYWEAENGIS